MSLVHRAPALLCAIVTAAALAQQPAPQPQPDAGLMKLDVVVTPGSRGTPVAGLPQSSFTVLDNGAPQPIRSFRALNSQTDPVKVLIVVDAVNLGFDRVAYERQELDKFLRANDGRLAAPTSLAIFTDTGTQIEPHYTTDGNVLSQAFDKQVIGLRDLRRSAGFYGATERLTLSLNTLDRLVSQAAGEPGRKFIVWVSPGWPLLSGPNIQISNRQQDQLFQQVVAFSNALRRANITMYVVDPIGAGEGVGRTSYYEEFVKGVRKPSQAFPGDLGAQVLSEQSGGLYLAGSNDIAAQIQQCFADTKAFYEIEYQTPPADAPNQYHSVQVRVVEPHMIARTRQGYYSNP